MIFIAHQSGWQTIPVASFFCLMIQVCLTRSWDETIHIPLRMFNFNPPYKFFIWLSDNINDFISNGSIDITKNFSWFYIAPWFFLCYLIWICCGWSPDVSNRLKFAFACHQRSRYWSKQFKLWWIGFYSRRVIGYRIKLDCYRSCLAHPADKLL